MSALHSVGKRGAIFFAFWCIFLIKYFVNIINNCIFVYQIRQIKNKNKKHYENDK